MSTIDEIMAAVYRSQFAASAYEASSGPGTGKLEIDMFAADGEVQAMITEALAEARREGAEAMREAIAAECSKTYTIPVPSGDVITEVERECYPNGMKAGWIRALPLPTGKRQAVRLTEDAIGEAVEVLPGGIDGFLKGWGWLQFAREIEEAVLAANGLGDGDE